MSKENVKNPILPERYTQETLKEQYRPLKEEDVEKKR
jgi:hypothetical protein